MNLILYTGPNCSLCDKAQNLIYAVLPSGSYQLEKVDVTTSLELKKNYGLRIPVLKDAASEQELAWPFDEAQLIQFCRSSSAS